MKITTKRYQLKYTVNNCEIIENCYKVFLDGKFICYLSKDNYINEWSCFVSVDSEYICGGLTKKECLESLTIGLTNNRIKL